MKTDFEAIVNIIFIVLAVIISLVSKLFQKKKPGEPSEPSKPGEKIRDIFSKISKEMGIDTGKKTSDPIGWDHIIRLNDADDVLYVDEGVVKTPEHPPVPPISSEKSEPVMPKTPPPVSKDSGYSVQELRKAVVWSEILAPPLALRE